jgi:hypothetical protein
MDGILLKWMNISNVFIHPQYMKKHFSIDPVLLLCPQNTLKPKTDYLLFGHPMKRKMIIYKFF